MNNSLQETLKYELEEIAGLRRKLVNLEKALKGAQQENESEKLIRQQIVNKLTENLNDVTQKLQIKLEENTKMSKEKQVKLETFYRNSLEQKEEEYCSKLKAADERLKKEITATSKAADRLKTLINENMSLRNTIRQLESQYTSETYYYKNEFKTLQSTNGNLVSEIESLKKRCGCLEECSMQITQENDDFKRELCVNSEKIRNLIKENEKILQDNNKCHSQFRQSENLNKELILNNKLLSFEKDKLNCSWGEMKETLDKYSNQIFCNISAHANFDFISKQNVTLKELVKAMRNERENFMARNEDAERRLEKLEMLMEALKNTTIRKFV